MRNPVYLEDKNGQKSFWGFTIVILKVPEIFSDSVVVEKTIDDNTSTEEIASDFVVMADVYKRQDCSY